MPWKEKANERKGRKGKGSKLRVLERICMEEVE